MFLTKAERRAQEKKTEKKASEDPFFFLVDVRDVSDSNDFVPRQYIALFCNASLILWRVEAISNAYMPIYMLGKLIHAIFSFD
jgi:hypothetical protein